MKFFSFLLAICIAGCTAGQTAGDPETQVAGLLAEMDWRGRNTIQPDASIDVSTFAVEYHRNRDRWDTAFAFLKDADLMSLTAGTHELDGRDVYALVTEYDARNHEDVHYEAHRQYADIHYVISGTEYIGMTDLSSASIRTPYNEERDIAFYDIAGGQNLLAGQETFFIFLPLTAHRPGMKVDANAPVKKLVIKVRS